MYTIMAVYQYSFPAPAPRPLFISKDQGEVCWTEQMKDMLFLSKGEAEAILEIPPTTNSADRLASLVQKIKDLRGDDLKDWQIVIAKIGFSWTSTYIGENGVDVNGGIAVVL